MRLIDADKLRTFGSINKGNFNSVETIQKWVDSAETVKAIPIEWIEKWLKAQERIVLISPPYYNQVRVPKMLEDWEKENEKGN